MPPKTKNYKKRNYKKRNYKKKYQPKQNNYSGGTRQTIQLLRPVSLKPKSCLKKVIFYNTAEVKNTLIGGQQNAQFISMYLNSPWLQASNLYAAQGTNLWNWNVAHSNHSNGTNVQTGTAYPNLFGQNEIGTQYQDLCIVGTKITLTATPLAAHAVCGPTAFFAQINSQSTDLTSSSKIEDLYAMPNTTLRKVSGNQSGASVLTSPKSCKIVLKYSPKRFNNIKDIRDNASFFAHVNQPGITASGSHPAELDRVTFGLVNTLSNPSVAKPACPVMVQMKMEAIILFSEPFTSRNNSIPVPAINV